RAVLTAEAPTRTVRRDGQTERAMLITLLTRWVTVRRRTGDLRRRGRCGRRDTRGQRRSDLRGTAAPAAAALRAADEPGRTRAARGCVGLGYRLGGDRERRRCRGGARRCGGRARRGCAPERRRGRRLLRSRPR